MRVTRREVLLTLALVASVMGSALLVVETKHENRTLVREIDELRAEHSRLETEWSQLQLEEATLAQRGRVEQIARDKAGMIEPREQRTIEWPAAAPSANAGDLRSSSMTPAAAPKAGSP